jgi:hypothetical protein
LDAEQDETPLTIKNIQFLDSTDSENTFYGTLSWRALVESPRKFNTDLLNPRFIHIPMKPHQANVFLVMLEEEWGEPYSISEHNQEYTGNLRIEGSCMSDLAAKHLSNPRCYLMTGWSSRLINNDDPGVVPQMNWLWFSFRSGHPIYIPVW